MSATAATARGESGRLTPPAERWICEPCGMVYDPEFGDLDGGIPAGTPFDEIPDTWTCPVCGARKRDFVPLFA